MVLAELRGDVSLRFEQFGNRRILFGQTLPGCRQADLQQPGAQRTLSGDEGNATGGTGLLAVIIGKDCSLTGDAIEVGGAIAHLAAVIGADVPVADIISHDDKDTRRRLLLGLRQRDRHGYGQDRGKQDQRHGSASGAILIPSIRPPVRFAS
jgi:hypothetical protein